MFFLAACRRCFKLLLIFVLFNTFFYLLVWNWVKVSTKKPIVVNKWQRRKVRQNVPQLMMPIVYGGGENASIYSTETGSQTNYHPKYHSNKKDSTLNTQNHLTTIIIILKWQTFKMYWDKSPILMQNPITKNRFYVKPCYRTPLT